MRWGILSTAQVNARIVAAIRGAGGEVVAVASRDAARAGAYAQEWGIERAYGSYDDLLGDPRVDAVYVPLPDALHCEWSVRALAAGRHVLCEKPLAQRGEDAEAMFDAAGRAGCVLMEGLMYRHHPQTRELEQLVADGAVGRLLSVRAWFTVELGDPANIRLRPELGGGALWGIGCYCVSSARLLA